MDASEIASYRALLQAQAAQPGPPRGWFGRGRRRADAILLTPVPTTPAPAPLTMAEPLAAEPLTLETVLAEAAAPPVPPPPARPPQFGRREEPRAAPIDAVADGEQRLGELRRRAVMLFAPAAAWDEAHSTPDMPVDRPERTSAASPGVIAGWSRVRPPSAQRRILARLEAVFLVEREGLDARRAAASA